MADSNIQDSPLIIDEATICYTCSILYHSTERFCLQCERQCSSVLFLLKVMMTWWMDTDFTRNHETIKITVNFVTMIVRQLIMLSIHTDSGEVDDAAGR